jgi:acylphosphatase
MMVLADSAILARIEGRVQGVWFRAWTHEQAEARGLSGWVRNCRDGSVEALFAGPIDQVRDMIAACHDGPKAARVLTVHETLASPPNAPGFRQLPTE